MDTKIKVGVIIEGNDGRVLLIKERLAKNQNSLWNIIKGSYDGNETIFETAIRECREEVSVEAELVSSLGVYVSEETGKIRVQLNFLAHTKTESAKIASAEEQASRGENIEELRWFTKEEVLKMRADDFISLRTYELLNDWILGKAFSIESYKQVVM